MAESDANPMNPVQGLWGCASGLERPLSIPWGRLPCQPCHRERASRASAQKVRQASSRSRGPGRLSKKSSVYPPCWLGHAHFGKSASTPRKSVMRRRDMNPEAAAALTSCSIRDTSSSVKPPSWPTSAVKYWRLKVTACRARWAWEDVGMVMSWYCMSALVLLSLVTRSKAETHRSRWLNPWRALRRRKGTERDISWPVRVGM